jgi:hypothetical protein
MQLTYKIIYCNQDGHQKLLLFLVGGRDQQKMGLTTVNWAAATLLQEERKKKN